MASDNLRKRKFKLYTHEQIMSSNPNKWYKFNTTFDLRYFYNTSDGGSEVCVFGGSRFNFRPITTDPFGVLVSMLLHYDSTKAYREIMDACRDFNRLTPSMDVDSPGQFIMMICYYFDLDIEELEKDERKLFRETIGECGYKIKFSNDHTFEQTCLFILARLLHCEHITFNFLRLFIDVGIEYGDHYQLYHTSQSPSALLDQLEAKYQDILPTLEIRMNNNRELAIKKRTEIRNRLFIEEFLRRFAKFTKSEIRIFMDAWTDCSRRYFHPRSLEMNLTNLKILFITNNLYQLTVSYEMISEIWKAMTSNSKTNLDIALSGIINESNDCSLCFLRQHGVKGILCDNIHDRWQQQRENSTSAIPQTPSAPPLEETVPVSATEDWKIPEGGEKISSDSIICDICYDRKKDVALVPCGHCYCNRCVTNVQICAICRSSIESYLKLHI